MKSLLFIFSFLFHSPFSQACTNTTVTTCAYQLAACQAGQAPDSSYPMTVNSLKFNYSKVDPAGDSTCTGDNGTVTCHAGSTSVGVTSLPVTDPNCSFTPANSLPSQVTCRYNTNICVVTCTSYTTTIVCL